MRIVSLIASASEILHVLGLTPYQVGRSHECDFPEEILTLPVCTSPTFPTGGSSAEIDALVKDRLATSVSIYEVSPQLLEQLRPTHILTQTQCKVCAVNLEDVERALCGQLQCRPQIVALEPNSLADIWRDIANVGAACGVPDRAAETIQRLQARMHDIELLAHRQARCPSIGCIEWLDPLMAAGNWVPELVEMANGKNLFGSAGLHSPWMSWQDLQSADPDVVVAMPCGFDLERTAAEMHGLTQHPAWTSLRAVREGQVYLTDGNRYLNRPGPGIVESLLILAEILHPGGFEPSLDGTGWSRFSG